MTSINNGKSPAMNDFLSAVGKKVFGRSHDEAACVTCGSKEITPEDFRDDISRKEFMISHMCQRCQDSVFGAEEK
jgi:hypothetical protein